MPACWTYTNLSSECACFCVCMRARKGQGCRRRTRSFSGKTQSPNRRKPLECRPGETPSRIPHYFAWSLDRGRLGAQRDQHSFVMGVKTWWWSLWFRDNTHDKEHGGFLAEAFLLFTFAFSGPWVSICRMSLLLQSLPAPWLMLHLKGSLTSFVNL